MLPALIMITTIATSSTGGNYAGPGGVVHAGSSYSSSEVYNVVGSTGTSSVHIETNVGGKTQTIDRTIPAGVPTSVELRASARNGAATSSVRISTSTRPAAVVSRSSLATSSIESASSSTKLALPAPAPLAPAWGEEIIRAINNFIRSLFSFVP